MKEIENFEFNKGKIYGVYSNHFYASKFFKIAKIGNSTYLCFKNMSEGFSFQKNIYFNAEYITQIVEFDSIEEYKEHYISWQETEKDRRLKGDF